MSLNDLAYNEVRIRTGNGCTLHQVPNFVIAGEALADGQFVYFGADGKFYKAAQTTATRATHVVKRAGVARVTHEEISDLIGVVQAGEPVMAFTGSGVVTLPFAGNVVAGQQLMLSNGYLVAWNGSETYVVGRAVEDVTIADGETYAWGDALVELPAQLVAAA
jgi:hypothetical protein